MAYKGEMGEQSEDDPLDFSRIEQWLDDPNVSVAELMAAFPFLRDEIDARELVESTRVALEDVRQGRTIPHEQIVRDVEERRRRYRPDAAE